MPKINFQEEQIFEAFIHKMIVDKGLAETDRQQNGKIQRLEPRQEAVKENSLKL